MRLSFLSIEDILQEKELGASEKNVCIFLFVKFGNGEFNTSDVLDEIALCLGLSERSVYRILSSIFDKGFFATEENTVKNDTDKNDSITNCEKKKENEKKKGAKKKSKRNKEKYKVLYIYNTPGGAFRTPPRRGG